jgi:hypothetical protein
MNKLIYALRNWKAHARALFLGNKMKTENGITFKGELGATVIRAGGKAEDLGVISKRSVTTAGCEFMVDDFDVGGATTDISLFNFHDSGTGVVAEAIADVDLGTVAGPTTRATGTKSQPTSVQFRSVGIISYTGTLAITEHGLFNQAARGAGSVLWDRSVFSAINVGNGDSIQFTYTLTVTAGG